VVQPKIARVIIQPISNNTARVQALQSGEVNGADLIQPTDVPTIKKNSKLKLLNRPSFNVAYVTIKSAHAPFNKLAVRQAVAYGLDRASVVKSFYAGRAQVAQEFINSYFAGFPRVRDFIDRTLAEARASGDVRTLYGRRRLVPELNSPNVQIRQAAERETVNLPIQGTAADILKRAMIDTHAALVRIPGARMILTVHDELLFEVKEADGDSAAALVRETMEGAATLRVPLTVDIGIGANWKEAKS